MENVQGCEIVTCHGVVLGEGSADMRDFAANLFGGRSGAYGCELIQTRSTALIDSEHPLHVMYIRSPSNANRLVAELAAGAHCSSRHGDWRAR